MRNLDRSCELNEHDLLAYADGELRGARLEYVDAHLRVCVPCQSWLKEFEHLRHLFQTSTQVSADPMRRAAVLASLSQGTSRRRQPWLPPRLAVVGLVTALLLAIAFPLASDADTLLGDFVRFGEIKIKERFEDPQPLAVPANPADGRADAPVIFNAVELASLPLGYALASSEAPRPDRLILYFENGDGASFLLRQGPTKPDTVVVPPGGGDWATSVEGTSVLITADPRPGVTGAVAWERHGVVFILMTIDEPSGGLPVSHALTIVEAVIAAQNQAMEGANGS